eukprot:14232235-Heterocapsa_arctica.AAC.1
MGRIGLIGSQGRGRKSWMQWKWSLRAARTPRRWSRSTCWNLVQPDGDLSEPPAVIELGMIISRRCVQTRQGSSE